MYGGGKVDGGKVGYVCGCGIVVDGGLVEVMFVGKGFVVVMGCELGGDIDVFGGGRGCLVVEE